MPSRLALTSLIAATLVPIGCQPQAGSNDTQDAKLVAKAHPKPKALPMVPRAKAAFEEVLRLIGEHYVDGQLPEDKIWTGAIEGVLGRLIQLKDIKVNTLLSPHQLKELHVGLKGRLSGIGAVLSKLQGKVLLIRDVLEGGAAKAAGLRAGDRILRIEGESVRELSMRQIVDKIRGPEGTKIRLLVQREADEWEKTIVRRTFRIESVVGAMLPEKVGYVRIRTFNNATVRDLDRELAKLTREGAAALVLDLRNCAGGLFDAALAATARFLTQGKVIVRLLRRGGKEDVRRAKGSTAPSKLRMVVLANRFTASGAEVMAAALRDHERAMLVGEKTAGKGTVERVLELGSKWAVKLSVARFLAPRGDSWQGKGVSPSFPVAFKPSKKRHYSARLELDPELDPQLRAALSVLKLAKR